MFQFTGFGYFFFNFVKKYNKEKNTQILQIKYLVSKHKVTNFDRYRKYNNKGHIE